jgi:hypothetical protein
LRARPDSVIDYGDQMKNDIDGRYVFAWAIVGMIILASLALLQGCAA